jgi:hypothetical protein
MSDEIVDVAMEGVFHGFTSAEFGQDAATAFVASTASVSSYLSYPSGGTRKGAT